MRLGTDVPVAQAGRRWFRLFPDDRRQALRVRRQLLASATALLACVALFIGHGLGLLPLRIAIAGSAIIMVLIVLFFSLFRTGLNLRFSDASLTTEQIAASILFLAYIMYYAPALRNSLSLFYMVAMLFGVLRLETRRLLGLALLALAAHSAMLLLAALNEPGIDLTAAMIQLAVLFMVLPWFAFMGGYVNSLRHRLSDSNRQLKDAIGRIEQIAIRDELSGAFNRRHLMDVLAREQSRARRLGSGFAVCLFDIDHFKIINDRFGHAAGDAVIRHVVVIAEAGLRSVDVVGRYGGEEFLLVLPDTDSRGAGAVAERIRADVEAAGFPQVPSDHRVTATFGAAAHQPDEAVDALLARADNALYQGKAAGRNRVVAVG